MNFLYYGQYWVRWKRGANKSQPLLIREQTHRINNFIPNILIETFIMRKYVEASQRTENKKAKEEASPVGRRMRDYLVCGGRSSFRSKAERRDEWCRREKQRNEHACDQRSKGKFTKKDQEDRRGKMRMEKWKPEKGEPRREIKKPLESRKNNHTSEKWHNYYTKHKASIVLINSTRQKILGVGLSLTLASQSAKIKGGITSIPMPISTMIQP